MSAINLPETNKPEHEPIFGEKVAWGFLAVLVTGALLFSGMAVVDKGRRAELETMERVSGVGDFDFHALPAAGTPLAVKDGVPLFAGEAREQRDYEMIKAGYDDGGKVMLYQVVRKREKPQKGYWVKVGAGRYAALRGEPAAPPSTQ